MVSLLYQIPLHGQDRDCCRSPSITAAAEFSAATLAVTPGQASASAPQSGNLVSVSRSDNSHSAPAVAARLASGLRPTGRLRPPIPNAGPIKLLPGTFCEIANSVCRAPKSASVASRLPKDISASPSLWPDFPCRLVCE